MKDNITHYNISERGANYEYLQANKVVPTEKARAYAESLGIPFLETSAKTATNIESAFLQVTTALIRARYEGSIYPSEL